MRRSATVGLYVTAIVMVAILIAGSCGPECINLISSSHSEEPTIPLHHIYTASSTILALTVFGSVLSVRIVADPGIVKAQRKGIHAIFASVIAIVAIHIHIMISTCCVSSIFTQSAYVCLMVLTMLFMFLLLLGFGALVDAQLRTAKDAHEKALDIDNDQDEYST